MAYECQGNDCTPSSYQSTGFSNSIRMQIELILRSLSSIASMFGCTVGRVMYAIWDKLMLSLTYVRARALSYFCSRPIAEYRNGLIDRLI